MTLPLALEGRLGRIAVVAIVTALICLSLTTGSFMLVTGAVSLAFIPQLVRGRNVLIILALLLFGSGVRVPMLPSGLDLAHYAMMAFVASVVLGRFMNEGGRRFPWSAPDYFLAVFGINLLVIIGIRGAGLRAFGSPVWGGMLYVHVLLTMFMFGLSRHLTLSVRQWRIAVVCMVIGYMIPAAVHMVFLSSGGAWGWLLDFVRPSFDLMVALGTMTSDSEFRRLTSLGPLGVAMVGATVIFMPGGGRRPTVVAALLVVAGLVLVGMGGQRSRLLYAFVPVVLFYLLERRGVLGRRAFGLAAGAVTIWLVLYMVADALPLAMQRTLSWIPLLPVDPVARADAAGTVEWRWDLWHRVWQAVPKYLWIGRGFGFQYESIPVHRTPEYALEAFYVLHQYHSGPLSLLVDTGLAGTVFCTGFFIAVCVEGVRRLADVQRGGTFIERAYRYYLAYVLWQTASFFAVNGDAGGWFAQYCVHVMVLRGLWQTAITEGAGQEANALRQPAVSGGGT
jgi:hypothetical protein